MNRISVASYNILANAYIKEEWYPHSRPEDLDWRQRRQLLASRIEGLDADLLCLQEVDRDAFDFLEDHLESKSYRGLYDRKGENKPDGCAVFYREPVLSLVSHQTLHYNDREKGARNSGHVAQILRLQCEAGLLEVANTHLKWDNQPQAQHIGYRQMAELRQTHLDAGPEGLGWIVCGDLNAQKSSFVLQELLQNGFRDAYADQQQNTCNANQKAKRIDFILHTAGLKSTPLDLPKIQDRTPLPSATEPSDHLPIQATFQRDRT